MKDTKRSEQVISFLTRVFYTATNRCSAMVFVYKADECTLRMKPNPRIFRQLFTWTPVASRANAPLRQASAVSFCEGERIDSGIPGMGRNPLPKTMVSCGFSLFLGDFSIQAPGGSLWIQ